MAIHIKESHEGIFKKAAKRAGMSTQAYASKEKHSDDPKMRKRATFAQNAAKWHH